MLLVYHKVPAGKGDVMPSDLALHRKTLLGRSRRVFEYGAQGRGGFDDCRSK